MDSPRDRVADITSTYLYSPLSKPISIDFFDDDGGTYTIEVAPLDMASYPAWQAAIIKKNIVDAIINEREKKYITPERRLEIEAEVEVNL